MPLEVIYAATNNFRWLIRHGIKTLQQAFVSQDNHGTVKWQDVPVVNEASAGEAS